MPYKDKAKHAKFMRERRKIARKIVDSYKNKPCKNCGNDYPTPVMHCHHRDPSQKNFGIAQAVQRVSGPKSFRLLEEELKKCDILCANCHIMEHIGSVLPGSEESPKLLEN